MPSGMRRAREVCLYERPVTSTATSVLAEVLWERGDRRIEFGGLEGRMRVARARIGDQIELVGERAGP